MNNELREYKIMCLGLTTKTIEPLVETDILDLPPEIKEGTIIANNTNGVMENLISDTAYKNFLSARRNREINKSKWDGYR